MRIELAEKVVAAVATVDVAVAVAVAVTIVIEYGSDGQCFAPFCLAFSTQSGYIFEKILIM